MKLRPDRNWLEKFLRSEWPEYEQWIVKNQPVDTAIWQKQRDEATSWRKPPLISVVTPVYNTHPCFLFECIFSVLMQSYPYWELCIVDDCSQRTETVVQLEAILGLDRRIKYKRLKKHSGISAALNAGVGMSKGLYVAFLDHDDVLHPEALFSVASCIRKLDETPDILYSDRDELSIRGLRFRYLLKPDWSPETVLFTHYLFHLTVWRRQFLLSFRKGWPFPNGPFRSEFDGAQDYELLLRASEKTERVYHIPRVLYHWRQHPSSISMNEEAKEYSFEASKRALQEALDRRGIPAVAEEIPWLWRGNYRLIFLRSPAGRLQVFRWERVDANRIRDLLLRFMDSDADYGVFLGPGIRPVGEESIDELINWFHFKRVGMVTGKILLTNGKIWHAGLALRRDGSALAVYRGFPESEPGYMAFTSIARNVAVPHPYCVAIRKEAVSEMLSPDLQGPCVFWDVAMRMRGRGYRVIYNAFSRFFISSPEERLEEDEREVFARIWKQQLEKGDPYYPKGLSMEEPYMPLALDD